MEKFIVILLLTISVVSAAPVREVTNQEIRDAIFSLVHSYHLLDNKLEKHHHREITVSEVIKRTLQTLQKNPKAFEPTNGLLSRLDERVSQIEKMLMQEEKYNLQSNKLGDTIEEVFKWMKENNECFNKKISTIQTTTPPPPPPSPTIISPPQQNNDELIKKIDLLSQNVKDLIKSSKEHLQQSEKLLTTKLTTADKIISKMEDKLTNFYITIPSTPSPQEINRNKEFETKVENYLENISLNLKEPFEDLRKISEKIIDIDRSINERANDTINSIEELKVDLFSTSDKALTKITSRVNESIEFNSHQMIQNISEIIQNQNSDLNKILQKRFDNMNETMAINHIELLKNVSTTMEKEISHVWRQIQIMYSEINDSKSVLKKIQLQTESYINSTISTNDGMEGNVDQIPNKTLSEIESNIDLLMGRVTVVIHKLSEFNIILHKGLNQISTRLQMLEDKFRAVDTRIT